MHTLGYTKREYWSLSTTKLVSSAFKLLLSKLVLLRVHVYTQSHSRWGIGKIPTPDKILFYLSTARVDWESRNYLLQIKSCRICLQFPSRLGIRRQPTSDKILSYSSTVKDLAVVLKYKIALMLQGGTVHRCLSGRYSPAPVSSCIPCS